MKQPALHMRLLAAILLTALCLSACGGETPPAETSMSATDVLATTGSETTPLSQTGSAALSETSDPAGQTEPVLPDKEPEYGLDGESGKITSVSIGTPEEWNRFARDFNGGRDRFADSLDVFIETQLSFADTAFVALKGGFAGRIYGPERGAETAFDTLKDRIALSAAQGRSNLYYLPDSKGGGFQNIGAVEGGLSLFGDRSDQLILEKLDFVNISYSLPQSEALHGEPYGMLCTEANSMFLSDVVFSACTFQNRWDMADVRRTVSCLLAANVGNLRADRVFVSCCDTEITTGSGGLLFGRVGYGVVLKGLCATGCSVASKSEAGDYAALLGGSFRQGGFMDVTLFDCEVSGPLVAALGGAGGSVVSLKDIVIESCFLNASDSGTDGSNGSGILFCAHTEEALAEEAELENLACIDSVVTLAGKDFTWYREKGINIQNCRNTDDGLTSELKKPEYGLDSESGKIASVSIGTPEEWNRFARDFNAERERFAASLDVFIETQLSFADMVFVALKGGFDGRIYGPERGEETWENVFEENGKNIMRSMAVDITGWYTDSTSERNAGFRDIHAVQGGTSLFGGVNGDMTIENLDFAYISYTADGGNGDYDGWRQSGMFCIEAETLTLDSVVFYDCGFRQKYTRKDYIVGGEGTPHYLLAGGVENLRLHRVFASNCDLVTGVGSGGLLFHDVTGDATFSELYLLGCSVTEVTADYGYLSLLGYSVGGKVDYEDITMFDCRTYGRLPSALGRAGSVGKLRNITVESCTFTVPQGSLTYSGSGSLLFFINGTIQEDYPDEVWYDLEGKTLEGVAPENVVFANCVTTLIGKDFDWYRNRGITIENCLNVTTGPAKRAYQQWMYGEVYD